MNSGWFAGSLSDGGVVAEVETTVLARGWCTCGGSFTVTGWPAPPLDLRERCKKCDGIPTVLPFLHMHIVRSW